MPGTLSIPYVACLVGAAGLYLVLRPARASVRAVGALLGLGALAWLFGAGVQLAGTATGERPNLFFALFALIAIASAVRMITHGRPVYSALYFVLVVLSSCGLFLLLEAEFMAFALVIVYAGAILITYLFVLMLAHQAPEAGQPDGVPEYDAVPREPLAACAVGFILLSLFSHVALDGVPQLTHDELALMQRQQAEWDELEQLPRQLDAIIQSRIPGATAPAGGYDVIGGAEGAQVTVVDPEGQVEVITLGDDDRPNNVQRVGIALVARFPASLELAGVILLMAMFGAVVLARRQIEIGEDETREAAGLARFDFAGEESGDHVEDDGEHDA